MFIFIWYNILVIRILYTLHKFFHIIYSYKYIWINNIYIIIIKNKHNYLYIIKNLQYNYNIIVFVDMKK